MKYITNTYKIKGFGRKYFKPQKIEVVGIFSPPILKNKK